MSGGTAWARAQAARAAGNGAEACRWLQRAGRLAPDDGAVQLALGIGLFEAGDPSAAAALERVAARWDVADAWIALAACRLAHDDRACLGALARALQARVVDPVLAALADRAVLRFGAAGWCGLGDGRVRSGPGRAGRVTLDGAEVNGARLPPDWRHGRLIEVGNRRGAFVGSPLPLRRLTEIAGVVAVAAGGIEGWAWHPADPGRDPAVLVRGVRGSLRLTLREPVDGVPGQPPLALPRRLRLSAAEAGALGWPLYVTDEAGRALLGSPLDPSWERPAQARPRTAPIETPPRAADVVIPVHGGAADTLACLRSVLSTVPEGTIVHVIDDASPEPGLIEAIEALGDAVRLLRHARNRGFPAAANAGIAAAGDRDVVLLNSDTVVPPGWLERLRRAAYAAPGIGSATPLSNEATIVSYPDPAGGNAVIEGADAIARRVNAGEVAAVPVGVGFCLYLRRDCLDQIGALREDLFAQGYGEEVDLCMRARGAGWRHLAALDVVVAHRGGASFGAAAAALRHRNAAIISRLYPGYDALIAAHIAADPLFEARRRMDVARWAEARRDRAVVLVTHAAGGGVAELVAARRAALEREGGRAIVLRPAPGGCAIEGWPNLRFRVPDELDALAELLRPDRAVRMEVHHLLGHHHAVLELAARLGIAIERWVHDDAAFCARIALVDGSRRYCGEPDLAGCETCVTAWGDKLGGDKLGGAEGGEAIRPRALVARSAAEFAGSARVIVPAADAARRLRRHFPLVQPEVIAWDDDHAWPPLAPRVPGAVVRVCVVGGIGVEKGYDVLLGCVHDAVERGLPLEFVVCGHTEDDERLLAAGPVFVTGPYAPGEAVGLIRAQGADLAFLPSIWPEVWCFALSRAWQAGLAAVTFDLGAQAERVRATGRGATLPLGLPIPAVNDALLRLARSGSPMQSPQP